MRKVGLMIRKVGWILCGLMVTLALTACGAPGQGGSSSPVESQAAPSVSPVESSQPEQEPESSVAARSSVESQEGEVESSQEALVLVQEDSGAEAGYEPTFTLAEDGTFELFVSFYDGTATITGTYTEQGGSYLLTPHESTAQGAMGSDVGEMTLTPEGEGYVYSGGQLGVIFDGAVFMPSQG